ncbi:MAG: hypothetical protein KJO50_00485 [Bacteroidia bacterium]|nr:hypothetical protein [Bacteroidia bacterium]
MMESCLKIILQLTVFLGFCGICSGQGDSELIGGHVSYVTSKNVYVKFESTSVINAGDTLILSRESQLKSCLVVRQKSSSSCVCQRIGDCQVSKDDQVFFKWIKTKNPTSENEEPSVNLNIDPVESIDTIYPDYEQDKNVPEFEQKIRGRISAASYSSLPEMQENRHRLMYRFSLNADHINNSRISFQSYINYRQYLNDGTQPSGRNNNFLRVYNLSLRYEANESTSLTLGRRINHKASSLGAIDGLQLEKFFGNFYTGLIAGFRPDIFEYDFNPDLFEYGAYLGLRSETSHVFSTTTAGLLEQRNQGFIDRRYIYFQHSSTINRKLSLFGSAELDLYNNINGDLRLTNLYTSARYRFSRRIELTLSYDSRKRILYYETFKTDIERLLDDDEARQGIRIRLGLRPIKFIYTGISFSNRFQSDQQNKSENINAYLSMVRLPLIKGSLSISFNQNKSNYLESRIYSIRHSRSIIKGKLTADFYFRNVNYAYLNSENGTSQNYFGAYLNLRLLKKLMFSILGELNTREEEKNYRVNTKLNFRF